MKEKRSKRYQELKKQIEPNKIYSPEEDISLVKKLSKAKFDEAVEVHLKLGTDIKRKNQAVRGSVMLPHGTGQKKKIAVFCSSALQEKAKQAGAFLVGAEEFIEKIKTTGKCDFDLAVATPEMMRSLAKIAKILGQKGLMPNPKNETITSDPVKTLEQLQKGKVAFKSDDSGNLHQIIGRVSFEDKQLLENLKAYLEAVKKAKPAEVKGVFIQSVTLCTTMGPGIKIHA